jgi:alkaline phosphatase D
VAREPGTLEPRNPGTPEPRNHLKPESALLPPAFCAGLLWQDSSLMAPEPDHWFDLFGRALTRRDLLRTGRDIAACIALSALPGEAAQDPGPGDPFQWGVASGDPAPDGVVLWTRLERAPGTRRALSVRWEVSENERFSRIARQGTSLAPSQLGHSVHVEVAGLRPDREYWYRFVAGRHISPVGKTRTAPALSSSPDSLAFAFASCQNYEHGFFTALRHLASEDVDFVVHLGDYIYEKRFSPNLTVRAIDAPEVMTLNDYRARYAVYRADADLQAAHAACPWIVTTDDHEVANNYAGAIAETPVPAAQFLLRRAAAYQAFYEFMPLRRTSLPAGPAMQLFRRVRFGNLAAFHVLDTRQYRSDQACSDGRKVRCAEALAPNRTMMGPAQERWLERGLHSSHARWNVLANQVMIAPARSLLNDQEVFGMDRWDGYVAAQQRLTRLLDATRQSNPVVITGDIHSNWVADLKQNLGDPDSLTVASEFVGTSISSGGDGSDTPSPMLRLNPHLKFFNGRRGYVRVRITPARWTADFRTVPFVSKPGAEIDTRASWIVEAGKPGAQIA